MEVLQALSGPVQLLSQFSEESGGEGQDTNQVQPISVVLFDVIHDVSMSHPL